MRPFTLDKRLEMYLKKTAGRVLPTVVYPELYRKRFCDAMERYFTVVPDKWTGFGPSWYEVVRQEGQTESVHCFILGNVFIGLITSIQCHTVILKLSYHLNMHNYCQKLNSIFQVICCHSNVWTLNIVLSLLINNYTHHPHTLVPPSHHVPMLNTCSDL